MKSPKRQTKLFQRTCPRKPFICLCGLCSCL
uniref:Uncharacterized protein n=1 Tax=Anguilla anguilla TaxID=7936 RepID=A0A0E9PIA2_ANGAN